MQSCHPVSQWQKSHGLPTARPPCTSLGPHIPVATNTGGISEVPMGPCSSCWPVCLHRFGDVFAAGSESPQMVWEHLGRCQRSCHLLVSHWGLGLGWGGLGLELGWGWDWDWVWGWGCGWVRIGLGWGWVGLDAVSRAGYYSVRTTISDSGHEFFTFPSGSAVRQNIFLVIVLSREYFYRVRWPE